MFVSGIGAKYKNCNYTNFSLFTNLQFFFDKLFFFCFFSFKMLPLNYREHRYFILKTTSVVHNICNMEVLSNK